MYVSEWILYPLCTDSSLPPYCTYFSLGKVQLDLSSTSTLLRFSLQLTVHQLPAVHSFNFSGGNTWAGGTGGRDTAGLGGKGGPYRLDAGHAVHQLSQAEKDSVPEHVKKAARQPFFSHKSDTRSLVGVKSVCPIPGKWDLSK
jgi:hypothetical protein